MQDAGTNISPRLDYGRTDARIEQGPRRDTSVERWKKKVEAMWWVGEKSPARSQKKREVARSEQGTSHCQQKGLVRGGLGGCCGQDGRLRGCVAMGDWICWTRAAARRRGSPGDGTNLLLLAPTCSGLAGCPTQRHSTEPSNGASGGGRAPHHLKPEAQADRGFFLVTSC